MKWLSNMEKMDGRQRRGLTRCLFFTCFFLAAGCLAILKGELRLADSFRQLSALCLMGAVLLPVYITD